MYEQKPMQTPAERKAMAQNLYAAAYRGDCQEVRKLTKDGTSTNEKTEVLHALLLVLDGTNSFQKNFKVIALTNSTTT